MKKVISGSAALIMFCTLLSCGQKKDAVAYNNELMTIINSEEAHISEMNSAMQSKKYDEAEKVAMKWDEAVKEDIKKVEKIGDFNGDDQLQQAILKGLKGYGKIVSEDYPKLINIRKSTTQDPVVEQELLDNINKAFEDMANGVNVASDKFEKDYAKK
jgi:Zn-dependent alcohol dehydrogenase